MRPKRLLFLVTLACLAVARPTAAQAPRVDAGVSDEVYSALLDFYQYDTQVPLDARVMKVDEAPTYRREKVVFTGGRRDRVPSYLMLPKAGRSPYPLVVIIDGWQGGKDRWWDDDSWPHGGLLTKALAAEGFAAFVLDAQFHGERSAKVDHALPEQVVCWGCGHTWRDVIVESVVDHRRALDYLASRGDIDMDRVGVLGHSMGGMMTFALAALEPRIRAVVPCVTPARATQAPFLDHAAIWPFTFAPRIKIPVLMMMGRTDDYYGESDARALLAAVGSADKALEFFDSGHRLPPEYVGRGVAWLKEALSGPRPRGRP